MLHVNQMLKELLDFVFDPVAQVMEMKDLWGQIGVALRAHVRPPGSEPGIGGKFYSGQTVELQLLSSSCDALGSKKDFFP